jgi:antitoxin component YwqK of YwqJK toxin-antitoxin module
VTVALAALCLTLGSVLVASAGAAEPPPEHLYYDVPKDAEKDGPSPNREGGTSVRYLDVVTKAALCEEEYTRKGVMVERKLFRNGKKHGVQRRWYDEGGKRLEEPYRDGMMDGIFRDWDEQV